MSQQNRILDFFRFKKFFEKVGIVLNSPHRGRFRTFSEARKVDVIYFEMRHKQLFDACQSGAVAAPSVHQNYRFSFAFNTEIEGHAT